MNKLKFGVTRNKLINDRARQAMYMLEKKVGVKCIPVQCEPYEDYLCSAVRLIKSGKLDAFAVNVHSLNKYFEEHKNDRNIIKTAAVFCVEDNRYVLMIKRGKKKIPDNIRVECDNEMTAAQLADIYDGTSCFLASGGIKPQLERLINEGSDGILLPSYVLSALKLNKKWQIKYKYFDSDKITGITGEDMTAIVCRSDSRLAAGCDITDIHTAKKLEIETELKEKLDRKYKSNKYICYDSICVTIKRGKLHLYIYVKMPYGSRHFNKAGSYSNKDMLISEVISEIDMYLQYCQ